MLGNKLFSRLRACTQFYSADERVSPDLAPRGLLTIRVPWITGHWGCGDPSHVRFFNHQTFNHWCEWYDQALHFNNGCRFEKVSVKFEENVNWDKDPFLAKAGIAAIEEMKIVLKKV